MIQTSRGKNKIKSLISRQRKRARASERERERERERGKELNKGGQNQPKGIIYVDLQ